MKSTLKNMVLVLFTITAVSAFLVGVVNNITKDTIKKTNDDAKLLALTEVLPAFEGEPLFEPDTMKIEGAQIVATRVSNKADGETVGYAVETHSLTKTGYADKIYLMVGFLADGTINEIKVLSQKETPGLGANMVKPGNSLEKGLKGHKASEVVFAVSKDDKRSGIDALSGATISSRAYVDAVAAAYAAFLWTTGQREQFEAVGDMPGGAVSGATKTTEPAAQEGDVDNE
ncbi:MAG: RnfABCDGE type electron transport complex subunit G [Alistipes sp.]|nr:RnfABCDGE type electron transport complex subunit G [Alistipes sp.]